MTLKETIQQARHKYYSNGGHYTKKQCAEQAPTTDAKEIRDICNLFDITSIEYIESEIWQKNKNKNF